MPSVFYKDSFWYLISGDASGKFFGYNYTYSYNFTTTPSWANVTQILNSTIGTTVGYRWYFKDSAGNINSTSIYTLTTTAVGTTTCTYSSGNWNINCSEGCTISTNYDVGGNNISIIGVGNYTKLHIEGTSSTNICRVRCINGGCFKN
jgi:hypothetical protein